MKISIIQALQAMKDGKVCFCEKTEKFYKMYSLLYEDTEEFISCKENNFHDNAKYHAHGLNYYEIISTWKIIEIEEKKHEIMPCIFCNSELYFCDSRMIFILLCPKCNYEFKWCGDVKIECIIEKHNEIYSKLHEEKPAEEKSFSNQLKELVPGLYETYINSGWNDQLIEEYKEKIKNNKIFDIKNEKSNFSDKLKELFPKIYDHYLQFKWTDKEINLNEKIIRTTLESKLVTCASKVPQR